MRGVRANLAHRDLVGAPRPLDLLPLDLLGTCPALGRSQDDHRPAGPIRDRAVAGRPLDLVDLLDHGIHDGCHLLMDHRGIVALDDIGMVPVSLHQGEQLRPRDARQDRRVRDLVAVQVQDRKDRPVVDRVEELVRMPARGQRPGLGFAVADDAADDEVGVVECGAVGMRERVTEFAAFVDRTGRLGRHVTRDPARERELAEQLAHPVRVLADARVDLAVGAFQVGVGNDRRTTVARPDHVDRVEVPIPDDPVHVRVDEVEPRRRAPVAEEARLRVLREERLAKEWVVEQVDLAHREVVRRSPVGVDPGEVGG